MKINYLEMSDIAELLDNIKKEKKFDTAIKTNTLFGFWKKISGKKFANVSKCDQLNTKGVLTVACKSSIVSNELLMFKEELLRQLNIYAKPLDLAVSDIVFSHKIWKEETEEDQPQAEEYTPQKPQISEEELNSIELNQEEIDSIQAALSKINFVDEQHKTRMMNSIIRSLKEQKFNRNKSE